jgi:tetratricopeptide (TPR) repeat protein
MVVLGSLPVAAEPLAAADVAAKALYVEAQGFYDTGKFEQALKGYSSAYDLKPLPGFLFNIGQCHRQLGNWERARFFYRRYLDLSPKRPKNATQVETLLAQVDAKLADAEALRRQAELAAKLENDRQQAVLDQQKKDSELAQARKLAAIQAEADARNAALARSLKEAPPAAPATPLYKQWWVWTGAAVLAAGAVTAWVVTTPKPTPTSLGEASLR